MVAFCIGDKINFANWPLFKEIRGVYKNSDTKQISNLLYVNNAMVNQEIPLRVTREFF